MPTAGITMVKDEADIIGETITRMAGEVDLLIVADNGSTDGTLEILRELANTVAIPLHVRHDADPAYFQSRKMTALAAEAAGLGYDWVIPFDADERWYSPEGRIADVLAELGDEIHTCTAELYDHMATGADPDGPPMASLGWRRCEPGGLPKVACRPRLAVTIEQGNHGARYPDALHDGLLIVRHFPYRSGEQMARKATNGGAAYAATDLPEYIGEHWRQYAHHIEVHGVEAFIRDVFEPHFYIADPHADDRLVFDPAP